VPFAFTGLIRHVVIEVEGPPFRDPDGEAQAAIMTR